MTWSEFLDKDISNNFNNQILTDIDCPKCGRKIYHDATVVLLTYPSKYKYWCSCGWQSFAHHKWIGQR